MIVHVVGDRGVPASQGNSICPLSRVVYTSVTLGLDHTAVLVGSAGSVTAAKHERKEGQSQRQHPGERGNECYVPRSKLRVGSDEARAGVVVTLRPRCEIVDEAAARMGKGRGAGTR